MGEENYAELLNPARVAYIQLSLNFEIVEPIISGGKNIDDYSSLKKAALNATKVALNTEIGEDDLTEDERADFSNKLERMLRFFPELDE